MKKLCKQINRLFGFKGKAKPQPVSLPEQPKPLILKKKKPKKKKIMRGRNWENPGAKLKARRRLFKRSRINNRANAKN